jgi:hypothetical protein
MFSLLRPGGELWWAENLEASLVHRLARRLFIPWASHWRYLPVDMIDELMEHSAWSVVETRGFLAAFGRNERQRDFLADLDDKLLSLLAIPPRRWRYIAAGVAGR